MSDTIIGIDLGTTNSAASIIDEDGPRLIPNALGEVLTPSVVGVDPEGNLVVGRSALELMVTHPERCASQFKRKMGSEWTATLAGKTFTPEELSGMVLRSLKQDAEAHLGRAVDRAVITVPAYFNDPQRKSTIHAGRIAGLTVERILNEPTAAALAYGHQDPGTERILLIFDLGGGTFDVSVVDVMDGAIEVRASAGEGFLGGEDFTRTLAVRLLDRWGLTFERTEMDAPKLVSRLIQQCEAAKRSLSRQGTSTIRLPDKDGRIPDGARIETVTRDDFRKWTDHLMARIETPIRRALGDAGLGKGDIQEVILVGGATRMPRVIERVADLFGRPPLCGINPDEVVALGAAVQAGLIGRDASVEDLVVTDVAPFSLGINICKTFGPERREGYFLPIIDRNTTIPVSRVQTVSTVVPNQTELKVEIYQGKGVGSRRTCGSASSMSRASPEARRGSRSRSDSPTTSTAFWRSRRPWRRRSGSSPTSSPGTPRGCRPRRSSGPSGRWRRSRPAPARRRPTATSSGGPNASSAKSAPTTGRPSASSSTASKPPSASATSKRSSGIARSSTTSSKCSTRRRKTARAKSKVKEARPMNLGDAPPGSLRRFAAGSVGLGDEVPEAEIPGFLFRKLRDEDFLPDPVGHEAMLALAGRASVGGSLLAEEAKRLDERRLADEIEEFADGFFGFGVAPRSERWRSLAEASARHPRLIARLRDLKAGLGVDREALGGTSAPEKRLLDDLLALFPMRPEARAIEARDRLRKFESDPAFADLDGRKLLDGIIRRHPAIGAISADFLIQHTRPPRKARPRPVKVQVTPRPKPAVEQRSTPYVLIAVIAIGVGGRLASTLNSWPSRSANPPINFDPSSTQNPTVRSAPITNPAARERMLLDEFKSRIRDELVKAGRGIDEPRLEALATWLPVEELPKVGGLLTIVLQGHWTRKVCDRFVDRLEQGLKAGVPEVSEGERAAIARRCFPQPVDPINPARPGSP